MPHTLPRVPSQPANGSSPQASPASSEPGVQPLPDNGAAPAAQPPSCGGKAGDHPAARVELSDREQAIIDEVAAAIRANPAKAEDLIAIALSHHPKLAHRLVLESIKRCPTAASRVIAAARLSRAIGARLVFGSLVAVALQKILGLDGSAQAAEPGQLEAGSAPQQAQVAAFLAGLNAALALMPHDAAAGESGEVRELPENGEAEDDGTDTATDGRGQTLAPLTELPGLAGALDETATDFVVDGIGAGGRGGATTAPSVPLRDVGPLLDDLAAEGFEIERDLETKPLDDPRIEVAATGAPEDSFAEDTGNGPGAPDKDSDDSHVDRKHEVRDTPNSDSLLIGTQDSDWFYGGEGDDVLLGRGGDDHLFGGRHSDWLIGDDGNDHLDGGAGRDYLRGGTGDDTLIGGDGRDHLMGEAGQDLMFGGSGTDWLIGGDGSDRIYGGAQGDVIYGGAGEDMLDGGKGRDYLNAGAGDDILIAGLGDDQLHGGAGLDTASYAGAGSAVDADLAAGTAVGADGRDRLSEIENLIGSGHDDRLAGDDGANSLEGGAGDDSLAGGAGDDWLAGGDGDDILAGGAGDDTYRVAAEDSGFDVLTDSEGRNLLLLEGFGEDSLVWAELHDNGDLDIVLRDADGQDRALVRVEGYASAPDAFAGVEINGRQVGTEDLIARSEIEPIALGTPESADAQGDILTSETDQTEDPDGDGGILAIDDSICRLPGDAGYDALLLPSDSVGLEVIVDALGQNVLRILEQPGDAKVWGQVTEAGDLELLIRGADQLDDLVATVEAYADSPDSLAAVEINGRTVALPDLLLGKDLVPPSLRQDETAPAMADAAGPSAVAVEVEDSAGQAVDSFQVETAAVADAKPLGGEIEDPLEDVRDGL